MRALTEEISRRSRVRHEVMKRSFTRSLAPVASLAAVSASSQPRPSSSSTLSSIRHRRGRSSLRMPSALQKWRARSVDSLRGRFTAWLAGNIAVQCRAATGLSRRAAIPRYRMKDIPDVFTTLWIMDAAGNVRRWRGLDPRVDLDFSWISIRDPSRTLGLNAGKRNGLLHHAVGVGNARHGGPQQSRLRRHRVHGARLAALSCALRQPRKIGAQMPSLPIISSLSPA